MKQRIIAVLGAALLTMAAAAPAVATPAKPSSDLAWTTTTIDQKGSLVWDVDGHSGALFALSAPADLTPETQTTVLRRDGDRWVPLPAIGLKNYRISSLAVGGPEDVWLAGVTDADQYETRPLLLHWNGTTWTEVPPPAIEFGQFGDVEIAPDGSIWVAGWARIGDREPGAVYRYAGGKWQALTAGIEDSINGNVLTVFSSTDAWLGLNAGLAHWDGKVWTYVDIPGGAIPTAMANDGSKDLWLAGVQHSDTGDHPLAMRYDGTRWTQAKVSVLDGQLSDIALWKGRPVAVGQRTEEVDGRIVIHPLLLDYDGSKFVPGPTPTTDNGGLLGLHATSTELWTTGYTQSATYQYSPLAAFTR